VCYNPVDFPFVGRKEAIKSFINHMENRKLARDLGEKNDVSSDKQANPLCVVQAAPGAGKSYFCDVLAAHDENFIQQHTEKGSFARTFMESCIGLAVTYNLKTPYTVNCDASSPVGGLASRILWR
jgi:hypothetical protein